MPLKVVLDGAVLKRVGLDRTNFERSKRKDGSDHSDCVDVSLRAICSGSSRYSRSRARMESSWRLPSLPPVTAPPVSPTVAPPVKPNDAKDTKTTDVKPGAEVKEIKPADSATPKK